MQDLNLLHSDGHRRELLDGWYPGEQDLFGAISLMAIISGRPTGAVTVGVAFAEKLVTVWRTLATRTRPKAEVNTIPENYPFMMLNVAGADAGAQRAFARAACPLLRLPARRRGRQIFIALLTFWRRFAVVRWYRRLCHHSIAGNAWAGGVPPESNGGVVSSRYFYRRLYFR